MEKGFGSKSVRVFRLHVPKDTDNDLISEESDSFIQSELRNIPMIF